jgi:hypothetical protein
MVKTDQKIGEIVVASQKMNISRRLSAVTIPSMDSINIAENEKAALFLIRGHIGSRVKRNEKSDTGDDQAKRRPSPSRRKLR